MSEAGRRLMYRIVSAVLLQPALLRLVGTLLRRWPTVAGLLGVAAGQFTAAQIFKRDTAFSNLAHAPNLVAGDFAIGMESGPRHDAERAYLQGKLPPPAAFGRAALAASKRRIAQWQGRDGPCFDLIEDYMVWVAWAGMRRMFRGAARAIEATPPATGREFTHSADMLAFFRELRYPGAHLLVGPVAPRDVQARARQSAAALNGRVAANLDVLRRAWEPHAGPDAQLQRNAAGLMWVGHPATTQAGALVVQELLGRPKVYRALRQQAAALGQRAWTDTGFRHCVRAHVIELLRLRPPFPILKRLVLRDTAYELDAHSRAAVQAGASVTALTAAAMADPAALRDAGAFCPHRAAADRSDEGGKHMVFGMGPRQCIAQDHVVEMLVSALVGLLTLPRLRWADGWWSRMRHDGVIITRMRLKVGP